MAHSMKMESTTGLWTITVDDDGNFHGQFDRTVLRNPWTFSSDTQELHRREISRVGHTLSGVFHQVVQ